MCVPVDAEMILRSSLCGVAEVTCSGTSLLNSHSLDGYAGAYFVSWAHEELYMYRIIEDTTVAKSGNSKPQK